MTKTSSGIHVVVPDMIGLCATAEELAAQNGDTLLHDAAVSVRSALVLQLNKKYAVLPESLRAHYRYVIDHTV